MSDRKKSHTATATMIAAALRVGITDAALGDFLDKRVGSGGWTYDQDADCWIVPNPDHDGPGSAFHVFPRHGDAFSAVVEAGEVQ